MPANKPNGRDERPGARSSASTPRQSNMNEKQQIQELRKALKNALSLVAYYQGVFRNPNFTDRHGDAERCDNARQYFASVLDKTEMPAAPSAKSTGTTEHSNVDSFAS